MKGTVRHEIVWRWSNRTFVMAGLLGPLVGFSLKFPVDADTPKAIKGVAEFFSTNAPLILLIATIVALVAQFIKGRTGNPWAWQTVESLLWELRKHLIADQYHREPLHRHRVTLFRYQRFKLRPAFTRLLTRGEPWRWPWKGWLVQVARSGHTTQNTKRIFCAPDNAEYAEGVAGQAWARLQTYDLPDIDVPSLDDPESISNYAQEACISEEYVKSRLRSGVALPLSMMGFPIERGTKDWGVIVVDSIHADGVESYGDLDTATVIAQTAISQLTSEL